jgi:hypothetical protein
VKERPILFQGAMVRALLAGTKTQTRRLVKYPAAEGTRGWHPIPTGFKFLPGGSARPVCPYGQPGDRLVVRETWQYADWTEDGYPFIRYRADDAKVLHERIPSDEWGEKLQDIWASLSAPENYAIDNTAADRRWRPAIHMPRWACRLVLEVTGVRVERLQDISDPDALAEGCSTKDMRDGDRLASVYARLWESINGSGSWGANPWVWVIEFKRKVAA